MRFSLCPYSAAQQPVQCRLHALVGSMSTAQGMLHWYFSRIFSCLGHASRLASTSSVLNSESRTPVSSCVMAFIISWYQLFCSSKARLNATRWLGNRLAGAYLSSTSITLREFACGSFTHQSIALLSATRFA